MDHPELDILAASAVRRAMVASGDIQADIGFQNDINCLLAQLEERAVPMQALGWLTPGAIDTRSRAAKRRQVAQHGLRILDGGADLRAELRQKADAAARERAAAPTLPTVPLVLAAASSSDSAPARVARPAAAGRHHR